MRTIRVVLDTSVVVSAHLNSEGYERSVLDLALSGKLRMFVSEAILREYEGVLRRPKFRLKPLSVSRSLRLLRAAAGIVAPYSQISVARDPGDSRFLECAEAAKAAPELMPNTETATAIASSKLLEAAVKARVVVLE